MKPGKWLLAILFVMATSLPFCSAAQSTDSQPATKLVMMPRKAQFFQARDGSMIVFGDEDGWGLRPFRSDDGKKFYELKMTGLGGGESISWYDHWTNKESGAQIKGDRLILGSKVFTKTKRQQSINVVPLPTVRRPEYLYQLENGEMIYVSADKYRYEYETFRLYLGPPTDLRRVTIKKVDRYRDGGTTDIKTSESNFHSPSPFHAAEDPATWKGAKIVRLDPNKYTIVETSAGATVSQK